MVDLAWGSRKVGWVQEPKGVLPSSDSRVAFVATKIGHAVLRLLILDISQTYRAGNPAFDHRVHLSTDGAETYIRGQPPVWRMINVLVASILSVCLIALPFDIFPAFSVALGFYKPSDWLPVFGSLGEAYTLRGFWG